LQNINDAELIKRAQNRRGKPTAGAEAVGELYDRYQESVFRYIWSRVSNPQLAEDLTGDVFTRMVVNLPKYRYTGAPFKAWLYSIARNLVIDNYRKASSRNQLPIEKAAEKRLQISARIRMDPLKLLKIRFLSNKFKLHCKNSHPTNKMSSFCALSWDYPCKK
jgi:RNA polymerase sigma factor (sigma-70 family)